MARLPQIIIPNQPVHILHWGNNRRGIFETEEDIAYALSRADCYLHIAM
jgi:putative transposase